jgi:hypothetical protein
MKAGFAYMNSVTVLQASQGLAEYIISTGIDGKTLLSLQFGLAIRLASKNRKVECASSCSAKMRFEEIGIFRDQLACIQLRHLLTWILKCQASLIMEPDRW